MHQMANAARFASQLMTHPMFASDSAIVTPHTCSTESAGKSNMTQFDVMALLCQLSLVIEKRVAALDLLDENLHQLHRFLT